MECPFCEEFETGLLPEGYRQLVPSRELHRTKNFAVFADVSPILIGHILIIPIEHKLSFGEISPELRNELDELLSETLEIFDKFGSGAVVLEHGSVLADGAGACIDHAHLQILPADISFDEAIARYRPQPVNSLWDVEHWAADNLPYLFYRNYEGRMVVADQLETLPRQFIRLVAANALHLRPLAWDWRSITLGENLVATVARYNGQWRKI